MTEFAIVVSIQYYRFIKVCCFTREPYLGSTDGEAGDPVNPLL